MHTHRDTDTAQLYGIALMQFGSRVHRELCAVCLRKTEEGTRGRLLKTFEAFPSWMACLPAPSSLGRRFFQLRSAALLLHDATCSCGGCRDSHMRAPNHFCLPSIPATRFSHSGKRWCTKALCFEALLRFEYRILMNRLCMMPAVGLRWRSQWPPLVCQSLLLPLAAVRSCVSKAAATADTPDGGERPLVKPVEPGPEECCQARETFCQR